MAGRTDALDRHGSTTRFDTGAPNAGKSPWNAPNSCAMQRRSRRAEEDGRGKSQASRARSRRPNSSEPGPPLPASSTVEAAPRGIRPAPVQDEEIPIHTLEYDPPPAPRCQHPSGSCRACTRDRKRGRFAACAGGDRASRVPAYPPTDLLNEIPGRTSYDSLELKEIAAPHQIQVRRVQRARHRGADQSRDPWSPPSSSSPKPASSTAASPR